MTNHHRFIILGTGGTFTFNVLKNLIKQNYKPLAYIQYGNSPEQNQTTFAEIKLEINKPRNTLSQLLKVQNIPVHFQQQTKISQFIKQLKAEFLLVACWPELIADDILSSVSKAALNLHPSLLPRYRGFDPVSDQIAAKDYNFGISLHLLNNEFDTGDIVLQQTIEIQLQTEKKVIEIKAATQGAALFIKAINSYKHPGWTLIKQSGYV